MSGFMGSGGMQGLGATGTGYNASGGNSLLMQLILQRLMSGGGTGGMSSFTPQTPMSGNIANNPLAGLLQARGGTMGGMNPQAQVAPTATQPNTGVGSALGGGNLQSLLQVLQNQQRMQQQQGPSTGPTGVLTTGIGNLLSGYNWGGMPNATTLQGLTGQAQQNVATGGPY